MDVDGRWWDYGHGKWLRYWRLGFRWVRFVIFYDGLRWEGSGLPLNAELLGFDQIGESARVLAAKTGFDAMVELQRLRALGCEVSDGKGETCGFGDELKFSFKIRLLVNYFQVEGGGFGEPIAANAPVSGCHFLDETDFDQANGIEASGEVGVKGFQIGGIFIAEEDGIRVAAVAQSVHRGPCLSLEGKRTS